MRVWLLSALLLTLPAHASEGWTRYSDKDGIQSSYKSMPDSKVLAMKGVADVDVPIDRLVGTFLDGTKSKDWVDLMIGFEEHPLGGGVQIERQVYDMPWPVWDRDFVFRRTTTFDQAQRTVRVFYKSVDDPMYPPIPDTVRGMDYGSFWEFTALPGGRTHVVIEVFVDPMGALPAWLVNSIQRSWPHDSVQALVARANKPDVVPLAELAVW